MRKSKREVRDRAEILRILDRCDTIHLGLHGDPYPYVVPLSFGWEEIDGMVHIYFHGAPERYKHELITRNPHVCVEACRLLDYAGTGASATAHYESVVGFGTVARCNFEQSVRGLQLLMQHCGFSSEGMEQCAALDITCVYCITLESLQAKRHLA